MRSLAVIVLAVLVLCTTGAAGARFSKGLRGVGQLEAADGCVDVRPPTSAQYSCSEQKGWGKCSEAWMTGYCKVTCGTCNAAAPTAGSTAKPVPASGTVSLDALHILVTTSHQTAPINHYPNYSVNKKKVLAALQATGMSQAEVRMLMAIGMLETNTYDAAQRDTSKSGASTNWSQFNINEDMLTRAGVSDYTSFNTWSGLANVANGLKALVSRYGVNGFLNYMRGGYDGWTTGTAYDAIGYRNAIASMLRIIDGSPSLLTDDRRIDMPVKHV